MNSRKIVDLLLILLTFGLYAVLILIAVTFNLPSEIGVNEGVNGEAFLNDFQTWSYVGLGFSLFATIFWYVVGEWGPKPHLTTSGKWLLWWFVGLLIALGGGVIVFWFQTHPTGPSEGSEYLALLDVGAAVVFYYLATLLFSPVNVKFTVPASKLFRRW